MHAQLATLALLTLLAVFSLPKEDHQSSKLYWGVSAQEVSFSATKRTFTGFDCLECLNSGRNHCEILQGSGEGLCCDIGDPTCKEEAAKADATNRCGQDSDYDFMTSRYTCPNQQQRCPAGKKEIVLSEIGKKTGFSDSWTFLKYPQNSFCKFRISTTHSDSNIILDLENLGGSAEVFVMVMTKGEFGYPQHSMVVKPDSQEKSLNVSGTFFEILIYVMPDSFSQGEYRVITYIEEAYKPESFKPIDPIPEKPDPGDGGDSGTEQPPTDPTDPVDPVDPADPVDPTDPTDPPDPPTDPSTPTDPTDPVQPTEPTEPTEPTDPTDPNNSSDGGETNPPVEPTDPEKPDPSEPDQKPIDPEEPSKNDTGQENPVEGNTTDPTTNDTSPTDPSGTGNETIPPSTTPNATEDKLLGILGELSEELGLTQESLLLAFLIVVVAVLGICYCFCTRNEKQEQVTQIQNMFQKHSNEQMLYIKQAIGDMESQYRGNSGMSSSFQPTTTNTQSHIYSNHMTSNQHNSRPISNIPMYPSYVMIVDENGNQQLVPQPMYYSNAPFMSRMPPEMSQSMTGSSSQQTAKLINTDLAKKRQKHVRQKNWDRWSQQNVPVEGAPFDNPAMAPVLRSIDNGKGGRKILSPSSEAHNDLESPDGNPYPGVRTSISQERLDSSGSHTEYYPGMSLKKKKKPYHLSSLDKKRNHRQRTTYSSAEKEESIEEEADIATQSFKSSRSAKVTFEHLTKKKSGRPVGSLQSLISTQNKPFRLDNVQSSNKDSSSLNRMETPQLTGAFIKHSPEMNPSMRQSGRRPNNRYEPAQSTEGNDRSFSQSSATGANTIDNMILTSSRGTKKLLKDDNKPGDLVRKSRSFSRPQGDPDDVRRIESSIHQIQKKFLPFGHAPSSSNISKLTSQPDQSDVYGKNPQSMNMTGKQKFSFDMSDLSRNKKPPLPARQGTTNPSEGCIPGSSRSGGIEAESVLHRKIVPPSKTIYLMDSESSKLGASSDSVMGPQRKSQIHRLADKSLATDSIIPTSSIETSSIQLTSTLHRGQHEAVRPVVDQHSQSTPPLTTSEITSSRMNSQRNNFFSDSSGQLQSSRSRPSGMDNQNEYKTPHFQRKTNNRYASAEGSSQKLKYGEEEEPEEEGEEEQSEEQMEQQEEPEEESSSAESTPAETPPEPKAEPKQEEKLVSKFKSFFKKFKPSFLKKKKAEADPAFGAQKEEQKEASLKEDSHASLELQTKLPRDIFVEQLDPSPAKPEEPEEPEEFELESLHEEEEEEDEIIEGDLVSSHLDESIRINVHRVDDLGANLMHKLHGSIESAILSVEDQKLEEEEEEKKSERHHHRQGSVPFNDAEDYNLTYSIENPSELRLSINDPKQARRSVKRMQKQIIMANLARAKHNTFLLPPPTESSVTAHPDETLGTKEDAYGVEQQFGQSTTQIEAKDPVPDAQDYLSAQDMLTAPKIEKANGQNGPLGGEVSDTSSFFHLVQTSQNSARQQDTKRSAFQTDRDANIEDLDSDDGDTDQQRFSASINQANQNLAIKTMLPVGNLNQSQLDLPSIHEDQAESEHTEGNISSKASVANGVPGGHFLMARQTLLKGAMPFDSKESEKSRQRPFQRLQQLNKTSEVPSFLRESDEIVMETSSCQSNGFDQELGAALASSTSSKDKPATGSISILGE